MGLWKGPQSFHLSQSIVSSACLFTVSQQNPHCPEGDVCAPFIPLLLSPPHAAGSSTSASSLPLLPSPGGLGNSAVPPVPSTGIPWGCQGDLEQSPCNSSQRVRSHNMNGNDFLSTDGEGRREAGEREGKKRKKGVGISL